MKAFDLSTARLSGTSLIEASAGTGKTFTIAGLFTRLIIEAGLKVEQILVVTYTKAATEELKSRIRDRLVETRRAFTERRSDDPHIQHLLQRTGDPTPAVARLQEAIVNFDQAAIFTIHGFCQRILHEHAFETGCLYDTELAVDPTPYSMAVAEDYWRKHLYPASPEFISFLLAEQHADDPSVFHRLIGYLSIPELVVLPQLDPPGMERLAVFRDLRRQVCDLWPQVRREVILQLTDPALDGRIYGSLKTAASNSGRCGRDVKLDLMAQAMDRYVRINGAGYPLGEGFEKFTAAFLSRATLKHRQTPQHPFFGLCDRLAKAALDLKEEMECQLLYLNTGFFRFYQREMAALKRFHNIQFYDDLLLGVRDALQQGSGDRGALLQAVRRKFKAALVDEFQDTDSVQVSIFNDLFMTPRSTFFMIGDPKQSIYGFRGADIFSYLAAAARAENRLTLSENWRSGQGLIKAVNTLFSRVEHPFVYRAIEFVPVKPGGAAGGSSPAERPAMQIWLLPAEEGRPLSKADAAERVAAATASEIARQVAADVNPVPPGDIAVLVRTNRQARLVKQYLSRNRVPSVLHGSGNVFDSPEATALAQVLTGILEHRREERFRAALVTDLMGLGAADLEAAEHFPQQWEQRRERFREYAETWNRIGFMPMFRTFLVREEVSARLLRLPDGDRRLTNLLHLGEVLHHREMTAQPGTIGLLRWYCDRCRPGAARSEEEMLRLESDDLAVRIVTIHRSKGLEYPVVFCPFLWEGAETRESGEIVFHDPGPPPRKLLDLGSDRYSEHLQFTRREMLAENLRLLYVAVTRARKRCYLVWGRVKGFESAALAYLLHSAGFPQEADVTTLLREHMAKLTDDQLLADLQALANKSDGTLTVTPLPDERTVQAPPPGAEDERLSCREFKGRITADWRVSSYSSLVYHRLQDSDRPDHDLHATPPQSEAPSPAGGEVPLRPTIHSFPRGTRAGIFFHDLFEHIDFALTATAAREALVRQRLQAYGYAERWTPVVSNALELVLGAALPTPDGILNLCSVERARRIHEMEFHFPVAAVAPRQLRKIFQTHGRSDRFPDFAIQLQRLSFSPSQGFLKGYVDLVFEHQGRFFLVDWKSNDLGGGTEAYSERNLERVMQDNYYVLQYCLYTLALDRHLRTRQPGYRYDEHFGGVYYIFLRGVASGGGSPAGVFYDRPPESLIRGLEKILAAPPEP